MGIQSERALVFTSRTELDAQLGEPRRLDLIRLPVVPMKRKLLPIAEVLRRRAECEVFGVQGSWQGSVVQNREFGPVKLGCFTFDGHKPDGSWRPGAKVRTRVPARCGVFFVCYQTDAYSCARAWQRLW